MTIKTEKRIMKETAIAYHELAIGLYRGYIRSGGRSLESETIQYLRIIADRSRVWRNILKTKEQKNFAVGRLTEMIGQEFGSDYASAYIQDTLPGFEA